MFACRKWLCQKCLSARHCSTLLHNLIYVRNCKLILVEDAMQLLPKLWQFCEPTSKLAAGISYANPATWD